MKRIQKTNGKEPEIKKFGVENHIFVWDIEEALNDEKVGYKKGTDYFVAEIDTHRENVYSIKSKMWKMLEECQDKLARKKDERNNRYVFIIDRRH